MASMRRNVPGRRAMKPKPAFPSRQMLVLGTFHAYLVRASLFARGGGSSPACSPLDHHSVLTREK